MRRARENPLPVLAWALIAAAGAAAVGTAVYVASRPKTTDNSGGSDVLTGPAISPDQPPPDTEESSAENAMAAAQAAAAVKAEAAQQAADAAASLLNRMTYQMTLAMGTASSAQLKPGDILRVSPGSPVGSPSGGGPWAWETTISGTQNGLTNLGTSNGQDAFLQATAPGRFTVVQRLANAAGAVFASASLTVVVAVSS